MKEPATKKKGEVDRCKRIWEAGTDTLRVIEPPGVLHKKEREREREKTFLKKRNPSFLSFTDKRKLEQITDGTIHQKYTTQPTITLHSTISLDKTEQKEEKMSQKKEEEVKLKKKYEN